MEYFQDFVVSDILSLESFYISCTGNDSTSPTTPVSSTSSTSDMGLTSVTPTKDVTISESGKICCHCVIKILLILLQFSFQCLYLIIVCCRNVKQTHGFKTKQEEKCQTQKKQPTSKTWSVWWNIGPWTYQLSYWYKRYPLALIVICKNYGDKILQIQKIVVSKWMIY